MCCLLKKPKLPLNKKLIDKLNYRSLFSKDKSMVFCLKHAARSIKKFRKDIIIDYQKFLELKTICDIFI